MQPMLRIPLITREVLRPSGCHNRIKGGQWNYLGTYAFGIGTYSVVLSDDANNYVIADAIKVSLEGSVVHYYPFPISDNPDADYIGEWMALDGQTEYGNDFYYHAVGREPIQRRGRSQFLRPATTMFMHGGQRVPTGLLMPSIQSTTKEGLIQLQSASKTGAEGGTT